MPLSLWLKLNCIYLLQGMATTTSHVLVNIATLQWRAIKQGVAGKTATAINLVCNRNITLNVNNKTVIY